MSAQSHSSETRSPRPLKLIRAVLIVAALIALTALAVNARSWLAPMLSIRQPDTTLNSRPSAATAVQPATTPEIESEIVAIRPQGFDPSELTRPVGRFLLMVDNRTGLADGVTLRLDREDGTRLREITMPSGQLDWQDVLELETGNYTLTEANHPDWVCHITITAQ